PQGQALAVLTCPFIRRPDRSLETDLQAARDQLAQAAAALSIR
ncbi:IclR family transcriptional regulator, partial [Rhizobium leguminosarum]|nr:IclR family transcriptional regulator [Rhizobium ruizarguesonis]